MKSQSHPDLYYTLTLLRWQCTSQSCHNKCTECAGLCRHMFECSCYDYSNGHICKQLHGLLIKVNNSEGMYIVIMCFLFSNATCSTWSNNDQRNEQYKGDHKYCCPRCNPYSIRLEDTVCLCYIIANAIINRFI